MLEAREKIDGDPVLQKLIENFDVHAIHLDLVKGSLAKEPQKTFLQNMSRNKES